jgi:hypothetical protein
VTFGPSARGSITQRVITEPRASLKYFWTRVLYLRSGPGTE